MHQKSHSLVCCYQPWSCCDQRHHSSVPQVLLFELFPQAFKLVVNLWNRWPKSQPVQSHVFFLHQNIMLISVFSEVTCMSCQTDRDLQASRDRLVWRDNTSIDTHKRDSIKWGREERKNDLKLKHVLLPQCSWAARPHYRPCVTACFLTAHSLLKFNRLWEAAVSLQEVRVTVYLWLIAPTHLSTLKAWL